MLLVITLSWLELNGWVTSDLLGPCAECSRLSDVSANVIVANFMDKCLPSSTSDICREHANYNAMSLPRTPKLRGT
jgi:hypothetical protein